MKLPHIVKLDWLIDSMMLGEIKDPQPYLLDISGVKFK
jgi:hypothetical protein